MIASEGTQPTRGTIARKAVRETVVAAVAWSAGAWVLWRFGHGTLESDLGLTIVALAVAIVVGVALTAAWQRRLPRWPGWRKRGYDIRWAISSLLFCLTVPAIARAVDAYRTMTALDVWVAFGLILVVVSLLEYGAKLLMPQGFTIPRPGGAAPVGAVVLVAALSLASLAAWWIANGIVAQAHLVPLVSDVLPPDVVQDVQPTMAQIAPPAWALIVTLTAAGFALWWAGAARAFFATTAGLYSFLILWSESVWRDVRVGDLVLNQDPRGLVLAQVASGGLFLLALLTASQFRPGRSLIRFAFKAPRYSTMP